MHLKDNSKNISENNREWLDKEQGDHIKPIHSLQMLTVQKNTN